MTDNPSLLDRELELVRNVAAEVAREAAHDLGRVLALITEAAGRATPSAKTAFLFNNALNEVYASERGAKTVVTHGDEAHVVRSLVPETSPVPAPGDASPVFHVPLVSGDQVLGLVGLRAHDGPISTEDRRLVQILAPYAALAIETSSRLCEARRFTEALSSLYIATQRMVPTQSVEPLREAIVKSAYSISGADLVVFYEYFAETGDVEVPPAVYGVLNVPEVQSQRGVARPHRSSVIFRMIARDEPFYAEEGLVHWQREGLLEESGANDPTFFAREGVASSCGIPLRLDENEPVGVLFANFRRPVRFGEALRQQINTFANQAALAIGNARLYQRSQRLGDNLRVLNRLGARLGPAATLRIEEIAQIIHEHTSLMVKSEKNFFICLYDEETDHYSLPYVKDEKDRQEILEERLGRGLTGYVIRTRKPQILSREEQERLFAEGRAELVGTQSHIWLGAPMKARDRVLGAIIIQSYDPTVAYTEGDLKLLTTIASQAAIAIDNYHLVKTAERRLSFQRALVECSPHAIIAVDSQGAVKEFNQAASRVWDLDRSNVLGTQVGDLYWGGHEETRRISGMLAEQETIRYVESYGRSSQGVKIPIHVSAALLHERAGDASGSVWVAEDLRLMALRGRPRQLIDAIERINAAEGLAPLAEAIVLHSASLLGADACCLLLYGQPTFKVQYCYGADGVGLTALAEENAQRWLQELSSFQGPAIWERTAGIDNVLRLRPKSCSSAFVPIRSETKLLAILVLESEESQHFGADIEILQVFASQAAIALNRAQLRAAQEETQRNLLHYANAIAVGQIATSFMHEAKNALHAMTLTLSNTAETLQRAPEFKSKKRMIDKLTGVEHEIGRIDSLSRRLQHFTTQGLKPEKSDTFVNAVVAATLDLMEGALEEKKIQVVKRFDGSLDPPTAGRGRPIRLDEQQIQQILMNLLLNAIAASRERGHVTVETFLDDRHGEVGIRITDEGRGIRDEDLGQLFTAFFTTKSNGTGLGLYISRILADLHGGKINVSSTSRGASFTVVLPRSG